MAIAEYKDEASDSSIIQPRTNGFYFCVEAVIVQELQRVITKLNGLLKKIATATLLLNFTVASCVLVEKPLNEAVMMGSGHVEFKCKSDQGFRLKWLIHQNLSKQVLFDGYSIYKEAESFCSVQNGAPGVFYLNLTAIHEAAHTYICQEPDTYNESSADLIIIVREAQCEIVTNNSHVIMRCDLEFRGNWPPGLEWSYNGTLIAEGVDTSIVSNKSVSSILTVPLSANDRNYTCTTKFDIRGKSNWTTSDNIPDYVSHSVQTVKANQTFSEKQEGKLPLSANGKLVGLVIGITVIIAAIVSAAIIFTRIIYLRERKKSAETIEHPAEVDPAEVDPAETIEDPAEVPDRSSQQMLI